MLFDWSLHVAAKADFLADACRQRRHQNRETLHARVGYEGDIVARMKRGRRKRDQTKEHCNGRVNGDWEPGRGNKAPPPLRTRERTATEGVLASWSPCSRWPTATRPPDERAEEHYLDND